MKKQFLHILIGMVTMIGCYSTICAEEVAIINQETKVYSSPVENAQYLYTAKKGEVLEVSDVVDNYYEIIRGDAKGYVESMYVSVMDEAELIAQKQEAQNTSNSIGEEVVSFAKKFIGTPYVSGGNNLYSGVDCSGFTQQVYKNFGVNLERSSGSQYACNGYNIKKEDLQVGDLVFYGYSNVCHVAIYVGDNQVIHAPVPGESVCVVPLWQRGDAPIVGYKRIL